MKHVIKREIITWKIFHTADTFNDIAYEWTITRNNRLVG
jgi:hypothetical protein